MTPALMMVLALACWLVFAPPGGFSRRRRLRLMRPPLIAAPGDPARRFDVGGGHDTVRSSAQGYGRPGMRGHPGLHAPGSTQRRLTFVPMPVLVQQSAALLSGGRAPARLWEELWLLYGREPPPSWQPSDEPQAVLSPLARASLAAARAAARCGAPVGAAIRGAATARGPGATPGRNPSVREGRAWIEFAACFDVAEASGSPLAGVLARFAAQLEAEDDAEAARQTAFAGPRATVRLLSWLPLLGLGLGMMLGVDPLGILLGEPAGLAALLAGAVLSAAGRIWSARLVRSAAGGP